MRNKKEQYYKHLPPTFLFICLISLLRLLSAPLQAVQREWRFSSVHNTSSPLLPPYTPSLSHHEVLPMRYSPPWTPPAWILSTGHSPSETDCPHVGAPWGHRSCQKTCSFLHGLPSTNSKDPVPVWNLHGCSFLQDTSPCSRVEPSMGSSVVLHVLQGDDLHHHSLHHWLQRISALVPDSNI